MIRRSNIWTLLTLSLLILLSEPLLARRGGGFSGGGRSFSRSSSFSAPRKTSSFSGTRQSSVNKNNYYRAKQNGTLYSNKSQAQSAFRNKYSKQYGSKFASKPSRRPDYIPNSTTVKGRQYPISYNSQYGGYGYLNALGTFVLYDALSDTLMMNRLMNQNGYYYGGGMRGGYIFGYNRGFFFFALFGILFLLISGPLTNRRRYRY